MRRRIVTVIFCVIGSVAVGPASAQSWVWPGSPHHAIQRHASHRSAPSTADIPLPVPRPHFADTDPAKNGVAPASAAKNDAAPAPATKNDAAPAPAIKNAAAPAAPSPPVAGSGAATAFNPRQPPDDPSCFGRLQARKVAVERAVLGPQPDSRCTVVEPVRLLSVPAQDGTTVALPDRPLIACETADAFSGYVHDLLAPLAKGSFGASLTAVWTGPGLECRARDHIFGAKLSAHGQGLAVDIAQVRFTDGRSVEVGTPRTAEETAFETAARAGACGYFHTVLGPGSDSYHRNHWHLDLLVRGKDGDGKWCK